MISAKLANPGHADILDAIRATSLRHAQNRALGPVGLDAEDWHALFRALIEAESAYRPAAMSPKGAFGLGQLMPETARALGIDRRDIAQNLDGSARYLLSQLEAFADIDHALAAYNAGPHRVIRYGGVPPFPETHRYIARIHNIRARVSARTSPRPAQGALIPPGRTAVVLGLD
ncbi:lytic transglycosylase domain-containing protein [Roseivivax halodurans]|uniref:lytic transglycosylase domain-containing protein n=1 Tax=Roseivivax halodurans TaxID=93683 RepID=UPI001FCBFD22|nr:lytic transglycosylase domain-containing protein [Roseivivax halodurans]